MDEPSNNMERFDHFQGFSAHRTHQQPMYQYGLHDGQILEEMISPRMPIPNPALLGNLPLSQAPGSDRNNGAEASQAHRHLSDQHGFGAMPINRAICGEPAMNHSWIAHHYSLPPLLTGTDGSGPAARFPETSRPLPSLPLCFAPSQQADHGLHLAPLNNNISRTIHVPSVSELSSVSAYGDGATILGHSNHLVDPGHKGHKNDTGAPVMYPDSGFGHAAMPPGSTYESPAHAMSRGSLGSRQGKGLADDVTEVHDLCLLATQRYLNALCVNWEFRHGRAKTILGKARGPLGRRTASSRVLKKQRWDVGGNDGYRDARLSAAPYSRRPRGGSGGERQARGEDDEVGDGLRPGTGSVGNDTGTRDESSAAQCAQHRRCSRGGGSSSSQQRESQSGQQQQCTPTNPISRSTDSLLQNTHHICDLIWRRAQRDRADVLGAEIRGCRDMMMMLDRAETIVLYNRIEFEKDPRGSFAKVLEAGKGICRQLEDREALEVLEGWHDGDGHDEGV